MQHNERAVCSSLFRAYLMLELNQR